MPESATTMVGPNDELKQKIGTDVDLRDVFTKERIMAGEREISLVREAVMEQASQQLESMYAVLGDGKWDEHIRQQLIEKCLAVKGQAEGMGFVLLTLILKSLLHFCEAHSELPEEKLIIVRKHLKALKIIVSQNIRDDGGMLGQELYSSIQQLVKKLS